jgi:hypothetical protein
MDNPINPPYPRCAVCQVPQYRHKLIGHQAYCTTPPRTGRGRPRKYPIGYKANTYQRYLKVRHPHTHGGARRGEAWMWEKTGQIAKRQWDDVKITQCEGEQRGEAEEERYPLAYVCAVTQKSRWTIKRYCKLYNIPRTLTTGPGQRKAALTVSQFQRLLAYLHR